MNSTLITVITAFVIGLVVYHFFFRPEVTEKIEYKERIVTDTTYQKLYQDLKMKVDSYETLNDSIEYYQKLYQKELGNVKLVHDSVFIDKPFSAPLRRYKGFESHLYGNTKYNALVAGNLLEMDIFNDFTIPQIENTIYKETTITRTIEQKGSLWLGGMVNQEVNLAPMAAYQRKKWMGVYKYELTTETHNFGAMIKVF